MPSTASRIICPDSIEPDDRITVSGTVVEVRGDYMRVTLDGRIGQDWARIDREGPEPRVVMA